MADDVLFVLLPQLEAVVVELVAAEDGVLVVTACTRDGPAACTGYHGHLEHEHLPGYASRAFADQWPEG